MPNSDYIMTVLRKACQSPEELSDLTVLATATEYIKAGRRVIHGESETRDVAALLNPTNAALVLALSQLLAATAMNFIKEFNNSNSKDEQTELPTDNRPKNG